MTTCFSRLLPGDWQRPGLAEREELNSGTQNGVRDQPRFAERGRGRHWAVHPTVLLMLLGILVLAASPGVQGQEWSPGGYLNAYGGANLMNDISVRTGTGSFKASPELGYRAGLAIGYELRPWLGIEFDTGFQENSLREPVSSSVKSMPLLLTAVFRWRTPVGVLPYAGVGAGGAVSTLDDPAGADINVVFGYQLTVGVEYELTPQLRVGVLYKLFGTTDQTYSIAGSEFKVSDVYSHFIGGNLSWTF